MFGGHVGGDPVAGEPGRERPTDPRGEEGRLDRVDPQPDRALLAGERPGERGLPDAGQAGQHVEGGGPQRLRIDPGR